MKTILVALAVATLAAALSANPAHARCWWNGHRTVCNHRWNAPPYWPRYPGWEHHRWCYYHPGWCR